MIEIQKAGPGQLSTVKELAYRIWPVVYSEMLSPGQLTYMLDLIYSITALEEQVAKGHQFYILLIDKVPSGFISYSLTEDDTPTCKLHKIYLLPELRGKGMGATLLQHVIKEAKNLKAAVLELNVNRHNPALKFYEKMGFNIVRMEDIPIGQGYFMNDFVMSRPLN